MDVNEFMIDRALDLLDLIPHITTIIDPANVGVSVYTTVAVVVQVVAAVDVGVAAVLAAVVIPVVVVA